MKQRALSCKHACYLFLFLFLFRFVFVASYLYHHSYLFYGLVASNHALATHHITSHRSLHHILVAPTMGNAGGKDGDKVPGRMPPDEEFHLVPHTSLTYDPRVTLHVSGINMVPHYIIQSFLFDVIAHSLMISIHHHHDIME
jgi:hypothetical protein